MEEPSKATTSGSDNGADDDDIDGIALSKSRASLIQTSFFSPNIDSKLFLTLCAQQSRKEFTDVEVLRQQSM